jgi:hypothetical protein
MMSAGYVAHFKLTAQIGPDDYETVTMTRVCNENTTIGELVEWYKHHTNQDAKCYFGISQAT